MKKTTNTMVSYSELRTSKGATIVISDTRLRNPLNGRMYLFNTERGEIVQYDKSIVSPKLFPLNEEDSLQAQDKYQQQWETARNEFFGYDEK
mgnify:FL=1